ncbi:porin [Vibrio nigripulchritudo]|uniref:porin n=1 Tax=Vibrio nigripulchritudo TaxID=28173 RepID=UPI0003B216C8|nr:porin [Vibrio nigripulchritudo]CCN71638.1 Outer membrane porin protein [Vibrio nigripulchritudo SFn118]
MDKIFKRTLLGAAVSAVALSGASNAAIDLNGKAVQFYGQAAGNITLIDPKASGSDNSVGAEIESRIGFRGVVEYEDFGPNIVWQIEGGNANNGDKSGALGARDTFLGLEFDGVGTFKYGRQLVAAYNYVDWPHSNPGLGNVFDWNNDLGVSFQDRADSVLRFDSASFGGFTLQATVSGMANSTDQNVVSVAGAYAHEKFNLHAGYYTRGSYSTFAESDVPKFIDDGNGNVIINPDYKEGDVETKHYAHSYAIVGGSVYLGDLTLTAAYKAMQADKATGGDNKQNAISATAQYVLDGKWVFKGGYAMTSDSTDGTDDGDTAITGRLGYLLPSTYLYTDIRHYNMDGSSDAKDGTRLLLGMEYYF